MTRLLGVLLVIGACRTPPPVEVSATPTEGVSIALYQLGEQSYAVVDDRRSVEIVDGRLSLERIDPGASLPTLVLEPLGGGALVVGTCARALAEVPAPEATKEHVDEELPPPEQEDAEDADVGELDADLPDDEAKPAPAAKTTTIAATTVTCTVSGAPGKHLVRVLYVSSTLSYRAQHDLAMRAADHVSLSTRYAIATPAWGGAADVTLFDGMPGGEQAAVEVARGRITLDGSTAIIAAPMVSVNARLRRIYTGDMANGTDDDDAVPDTVAAVWVWLELDLPRLAPGPVHAEVALIDEAEKTVDVPAAGREQGASSLRLPLWIDPTLHGSRTRRRVRHEGADTAEWFSVAITNTGEATREVWIEQALDETARRRLVTYGQPTKPTLGKQRARSKVVVPAKKTARVSYTISYTY